MLQSQRVQYKTTNHHDKTQHLVHLKSDAKSYFNSAAADQAADLKLSGGYKTKSCSIHFIKLSITGECIECSE